MLLEEGALVSATDHNSSTPLHLACQKGHQKCTVSYVQCTLVDGHSNVKNEREKKRELEIGRTGVAERERDLKGVCGTGQEGELYYITLDPHSLTCSFTAAAAVG